MERAYFLDNEGWLRQVAFRLDVVPPRVTAQMKRLHGGTGRFFKGSALAAAEREFAVLLKPHRPAEPLRGPVGLEVTVVWPWRSGEPKRRRALGETRHTVRPDGSNWIKAFEDAMTRAGFWTDDAQISDLTVRKRWGDAPGIRVVASELGVEG